MLSGEQASLLPPGSKSGVVFSEADWVAERVAVVASGPSFFDPQTSAHVLSVKGTIKHLTKVDSWFSLDVNDRCLPILKMPPREGVRYVLAVPEDYGPKSKRHWHRTVFPHVTYLHRVSADGVSQDKGTIHSGNSAWGAFQLALHMGAKRIVLIGIDANQECYGYSLEKERRANSRRGVVRNYSQRPRGLLKHVPALFESAVLPPGVEVVNASLKSRVTRFPKMQPVEAIKWLEGD